MEGKKVMSKNNYDIITTYKSIKEYDATLQIIEKGPIPQEILVDQGSADSFLKEQLLSEALEAACYKVNQKLNLRMQVLDCLLNDMLNNILTIFSYSLGRL
jgi:S-formylglutathione hydrolase FrmB